MGKKAKLKRLWNKLKEKEHMQKCDDPKCKVCNEIRAVINHYSPFYSGGVLFNSDGNKILLGERRSDGIWTGPAGHAADGENPRETMVREAFEETGIVIQPEELIDLPIITTYNNKSCHCFMMFAPEGFVPTNKNDPDREVKEWKWFDVDGELPEPMDENRSHSIVNAKMKMNGLIKAMVLNENIPGVDLNTSEFSMDSMAAQRSPLFEYLENCMNGMSSGEPNREIALKNDNLLSIGKVDDGCYSGWVKNSSRDVVLRLDKMPIASLVQTLEAKEFMRDGSISQAEPKPEEAPAKEPMQPREDINSILGEQVIQMVEQHEKEWESKEGSPAEEAADAAQFEQVESLVEPLLPKAEEESSDREELSEILDALSGFQAKEIHIHIHKSLESLESELIKAGEIKDKGGFPVGTLKDHEGKKYRKFADGHWVEHKEEEEDSEAKIQEAVEKTKAEIAQKQHDEAMKQHEKDLNEIKARLDKMAEQRAKERGQPIKDTPAKAKKDLKKVEKNHEKLKA